MLNALCSAQSPKIQWGGGELETTLTDGLPAIIGTTPVSSGLWRASWPRLAWTVDAVAASTPMRALARGADWLHRTVLYDGLREAIQNIQPWADQSRAAARAMAGLGPDYIENAIRRLLANEDDYSRAGRIAQLGEPAIPILRRIIEAEPKHRTVAIDSLYHMGLPATEVLRDLMTSYSADVRFAVARVIVGNMTCRGSGSLIVPPFHEIILTAFKVYGEYVSATARGADDYTSRGLLLPYENNYLLTLGGYAHREDVIPVLTALLMNPDMHIDLRMRAAQLLFWFSPHSGYRHDLTTGWVEEPTLWAIRQEDPLLRLACLANLYEINQPQGNRRGQIVVPHIGQFGLARGTEIVGLVDLQTGICLIYPKIKDYNWLDVVRQFQDWERRGQNDPRVMAAAQTILDGAVFSYEMAFQG